MKKDFNVLGMNFNSKNSIIVSGISLAVFLFLLGLNLLGVSVSWYGVLIGTGFLVALLFSCKLAKYRGLNEDFPFDLIWWVFPLSIVFARAYYVICSPNEFNSFYEMIAIWNGGNAIYGGIIGGLLGLIICCLIKKKNIICTTDLVAPGLILAQAIGRWGNFINQEVYGTKITNESLKWFPFGVYITKNGINEWHLATFFYESVLNLIGFFILLYLLRKVNIKGIVTFSYLMYYGIVRYFLEGLREKQYILNIPNTSLAVSQVVSLAIVFIGLVGLIVCLIVHNKQKGQLNDQVKNL